MVDGSSTHTCFVGSHLREPLHRSASSNCAQSSSPEQIHLCSLPWHLPLRHWSPPVQGSLSSQGVPSFRGVWMHRPVCGSHKSLVQGFESSQFFSSSGLHTPSRHLSPRVHGLPSSQGLPSSVGSGISLHLWSEVSHVHLLQGTGFSSSQSLFVLQDPPVTSENESDMSEAGAWGAVRPELSQAARPTRSSEIARLIPPFYGSEGIFSTGSTS